LREGKEWHRRELEASGPVDFYAMGTVSGKGVGHRKKGILDEMRAEP